jgi:hypothetical protein
MTLRDLVSDYTALHYDVECLAFPHLSDWELTACRGLEARVGRYKLSAPGEPIKFFDTFDEAFNELNELCGI